MPAHKAGSAHKRISGRALQTLRARILRANPLCVHCQQQGRIAAAVVVDHVVSLQAGGTYEDANLQGLCVPCHDIKTRRDIGQAVHGCDARGLPIDDAHHWRTERGGGG